MLPGSLLTNRYQRCAKPACRCHGEPPQLHGPYALWTRAEVGKTVTRLLGPDELEVYRDWFDDARTLRDIITGLQTLSVAIVERRRGRRS